MGTYIHYLIESLYFEAYCYNAEVNHKYTLIYIDIWEKKGVLNALSPRLHFFLLSPPLFSPQLYLLLFCIPMNLLPQSFIYGN